MLKDRDRAGRRAEAQAEQTREAAARLVAERVAQGLPPKITDPAVLTRIAAILRSAGSPLSKRRKPDSQQQ